uniref:Ig-like domain-containing protein n=1 Tax=Timema bartmani TaxID=61472 RepID=A0A7R9I0S8_9NEOP|nr:unnamed protein product [Timema bartmani]
MQSYQEYVFYNQTSQEGTKLIIHAMFSFINTIQFHGVVVNAPGYESWGTRFDSQLISWIFFSSGELSQWSPEVVAMQEYTIDAGSSIVVRGNSAVLRCIVPSFVKDFIKVTSWLQDGNFNIFPSRDGDGKLHMLPTGELVVVNAGSADSYSTYQCRVAHRLSGETRVSTGVARISVSEAHGLTPPRFSERTLSIEAPRDELVVLPCFAEGDPPPEYRTISNGARGLVFFKTTCPKLCGCVVPQTFVCGKRNSEATVSLFARHASPERSVLQTRPLQNLQTRLKMLVCRWEFGGSPVPEDEQRYTSGGLLIIPRARPHDSGRYTCTASNPAGNSRLDVSLLVSWPLSARVSPALLTAGLDSNSICYVYVTPTNYQCALGQPAQLTCTTTGHPVTMVLWMKNGQSLSSLRGGMSGEVFHLASVSREDQGMYQCFVKNEKDMAQGTAELRLGGELG